MTGSRRDNLSRRDFLGAIAIWTGGLIAALIGVPSLGYLIAPALRSRNDEGLIDLGSLEQYPVGVPTRFEFIRTRVNGWERTSVSHGMFVVRTDDQEVRIFSDICTHLGCRVSWHPDIQHYVSPCHDGHFDLMGKNISGPPPRPLDEYPARIESDRILVSLPALKRTR